MAQTRLTFKEFGSVFVDSRAVLTTETATPVYITSTESSQSVDSGALVISGGMGVSGNLTIGKEIVALGGLDAAGQRITGVAPPVQPNDVVTLGFFSTNSGGLTSGNGILKELNRISTSPSQLHVTALGTISTGTWRASTIDVGYGGTGSTLIPSGQIVFGAGTNPLQTDPTLVFNNVTKTVSLGGINDSQDPLTGTLVVAGGVGIGKSLTVGGSLTVTGQTVFKSTIIFTDTTDSTDQSLGSLSITGGATVGKNLNVLGCL